MFEVRLNGVAIGRYDTEPDAIDCVRRPMKDDPNSEPELLDRETGKPVTPAASRGWREHLSHQVGY